MKTQPWTSDRWIWGAGDGVLALRAEWNVSTSSVYRLFQHGVLTFPTACGSLYAQYDAHLDAVHDRHAKDAYWMRLRRALKRLP
jgi:hypothetical protein